MEKEFNLSEKEKYPKTFGYKYEDVKEFIKRRENVIGEYLRGEITLNMMWIKLHKLAGEKLNGKPIDLSGRS